MFPTADAVIAGTDDGDLRCWSLSTGALEFKVTGTVYVTMGGWTRRQSVCSLSFVKSTGALVTGHENGAIVRHQLKIASPSVSSAPPPAVRILFASLSCLRHLHALSILRRRMPACAFLWATFRRSSAFFDRARRRIPGQPRMPRD